MMFLSKLNEPGQCLGRRMKNTRQRCIMLLNPSVDAQQNAGQSLCGKVLGLPIYHLRSHRRSDRILDINSHRGTGFRQLRVVSGQNSHAALAGAFQEDRIVEINPIGLPKRQGCSGDGRRQVFHDQSPPQISEFCIRVILRHPVNGNEHAPQLHAVDATRDPHRVAGDVLLTSRHGRMVSERSVDQQIGVNRLHTTSYQPSASMSMSARSRWLGRFINSFRSRAASTGVLGKGFTKMPSLQRTSSTSCSGPNSSPHSAGMRNRRSDSIRVTTLDISGPSFGFLETEAIISDAPQSALSKLFMAARCLIVSRHPIASRSRSSWASRAGSRTGGGAALTAWRIFSARRRKVARSPAFTRKPTNVPADLRGLNQHSGWVHATLCSAGIESAMLLRMANSHSPPARRASLNVTFRRCANGWDCPGNQLTEPRRSLTSNPLPWIKRVSSSLAAPKSRSCPTATVWIASIFTISFRRTRFRKYVSFLECNGLPIGRQNNFSINFLMRRPVLGLPGVGNS